MDFVIKNGLAVLVVGLACARACEQLIHLRRNHKDAVSPALTAGTSMLSPAAGLAALACGYLIDAYPALLLAAWLNTLAPSAWVAIKVADVRRGSERVLIEAGEIAHE